MLLRLKENYVNKISAYQTTRVLITVKDPNNPDGSFIRDNTFYKLISRFKSYRNNSHDHDYPASAASCARFVKDVYDSFDKILATKSKISTKDLQEGALTLAKYQYVKNDSNTFNGETIDGDIIPAFA